MNEFSEPKPEHNLAGLKIERTKRKNPEAGKKRALIGASIVVILLILSGVYYAFGDLFDPAVEVRLVPAILQTPAESEALLTGNGYVVAQRKASIASKAMGRLVFLKVVEGDRVVKDQVIAGVEDRDIRAHIAEAEANLKLTQAELKEAESNFRRLKQLLANGAATEIEAEAAETRYNRVLSSIDLAETQIKSLKVDLENTLIRAPFSGTVLTKNAEVGEVVSPISGGANSRAAVVTIADMNSLQVEADVSEANIEKVKPDMECVIYLDAYPDHGYPGYVAKIVPTADRAKATVLVKIGFRDYDSKVLPEMRARVSFMAEPVKGATGKPFLAVPATAVFKKNGKSYVYRVAEGKLAAVEVRTGKVAGLMIEITSGLNEGDQIVEKITKHLSEGVKVAVKK
ncbi:MAG: efflux RND transporter periplasmic adaptor subunit [Ignavibacteriales bacterium]|jgi:RND family efflux transporter, MFP subunit|nr:MAG: efflux RND transporter periplasmic adaptor subunit [Ignavibacteriaceae bacterium]MBW7873490.1 efflux RND transporter periplasmic adaptor subunit [Ignavibacteria bacterium]MCZ2142181.1 efflux RND transporter periplasmic adaptor subunit [Ignavibacteriales bacterium]OQY70215.1 MAG: hypothetical protein B6D45_11555 [Ignavibacteriales bacterium UTCHB3]MBV6444916.1 Macrolide export protein MacA [Ignavibacteriaceae bacterium]